jgi:putative ABC transport system ATP-binding protein
MLKIHDLTKNYRQGDITVEVLKGLNLNVKAGEHVAILGPSGSGKSTFLSLVSGLDRPTSGSIKLNNKEFTSLGQKELTHFRSAHIGIVFQQFHLLSNLSALENVRLPLLITGVHDSGGKAEKLLDRVGLAHRMNHFPSQMSGGENQRVAIARALINEPDLLLADEPSGNLDSEIGGRVMDLLFEIVKEKKSTLLLVTHNEELAQRCERQVWLKNGHFQ